MKLWGAETVSQLGSQVSAIALPFVAIVVLEVSAFEVAALTVVEMAPFILISLPAGVWVDRLRRKPILVVADLGRALLLASVPVAHWLGVLTIWQLYVVGFAVGVLTVFFDVSYQSYLPSLVAHNALIPVLLSPVRTLREMPEPVEEPLPSEADAAGGIVSPTQAAVPTESP